MNNKFKTFEDIEYMPLRVFNRVMLTTNIVKDFGQDVAATYLGKFTDKERNQMMVMTMAISAKGADAVRKTITRDLELETQ